MATLSMIEYGILQEDETRLLHRNFVYVPISYKRSNKIQQLVWKKMEELKQNYMATTRGLKPMPFLDRFNIYAKARTEHYFAGMS